MKTIELTIPACRHATAILIEPGLLHSMGQRLTQRLAPSKVLLVSDLTVAGLWAERVTASVHDAGLAVVAHLFAPGEASKSLSTVEAILEELSRMRMGRDGLILALGGGVVSDVAGFAAAVWMRGMRFAVAPTTMEAMLDASVGGKTGVNLPAGKNLVGAFHHPALVLVDPQCLDTLPARDVRAGLAESVKHALVFDERFLAWHERQAPAILAGDAGVQAELIERNLRIKADVVAADPLERSGRRMLLNFGHTLGHALEAACGCKLRHGECVAIGMASACRMSQELAGLPPADSQRALRLLRALELPTRLSETAEPVESPDPLALHERLGLDKKQASGTNRFVLLEALGRPVVVQDVQEEVIQRHVEALLS